MKKLIYLLILFLVATLLTAQESLPPRSQQDKVKEMLEKATVLHRQAEQKGDRKLDEQAEVLFKQVVALDPQSYVAYSQLGWIYNRWKSKNYYDPDFLDSAFYFANKALEANNQNSGVYRLHIMLNDKKGHFDKAIEAFQSALKYESFDSLSTTYRIGASVYFNSGDYTSGINYDLKQYQLEKNRKLALNSLSQMFFHFSRTGFTKESQACNNKMLELNKDTIGYLTRMMFDQFISGRYDDMISTGLEKSGKYPDNLTIKYYLGWGYLFARNFDESYNWFKKAFDQVKAMGQTPNPDEAWGFVCLQKGMKEEADLYLNKPISNYERNAKFNYYAESNLPFLGLSWIYASKGDKEKALAYLKENKSFHSQAVNMVKYSPMLDNIRNEPEFAQILKNMEDKLKKEQKQISKLVNDFGGID